MGERGFHQPQFELGADLITKAISYIESPPEIELIIKENKEKFNHLYTWYEKILVTKNCQLQLGFCNFSEVKKGDLIGSDHGKNIYINNDGMMLFPTYTLANKTNNEFCRIIKKISVEDIPKND